MYLRLVVPCATLVLLTADKAWTAPDGASSGSFDDLSRSAAAALDKRPSEAVELYRKALALKPSWAEGWLYLGATLSQLHRYPEACSALKAGIPLAPPNGTAWAFLGICEFEQGNTQVARANFNKAFTLGITSNPPFEAEVRTRAALIDIKASSFEAALEMLQPLTRAGVKTAPAVMAAGLAALRRPRAPGDLTAREAQLARLAGEAAWEYAAHHPDQASAAFRQLVADFPNEPGVHYLHGMYMVELDPDAAITEFRREIELDSSHVLARVQLALLQVKAGRADQALKPANEAVALDPKNYLARAALGRTNLALGDAPKAIVELEAAARLMPAEPQIHYYLEQAYRRAGRTKDAARAKAEFQRRKAAVDPLSQTASPSTAASAGAVSK